MALLLVSGVVSILLYGFTASGLVPQKPAPNPFGFGMRESSGASGGLGGLVQLLQAQFLAALTGSIQALKRGDAATASLVTIGFLYGVFHAVGPGHGKGVISAYLLATRRGLPEAFALSLCSALLQGTVAILLVSVLVVVAHAGMATVKVAASGIETVSFAAIGAIGAALIWFKSGEAFDALYRPGSGDLALGKGLPRPRSWRGVFAVILAAGVRPCSGAILLLVFALSQNVFLAGVLATLTMACGTAITTGCITAVTVAARGAARRITNVGGVAPRAAIAFLELLAAAFIFILGATLLMGVMTSGLPGMLD